MLYLSQILPLRFLTWSLPTPNYLGNWDKISNYENKLKIRYESRKIKVHNYLRVRIQKAPPGIAELATSDFQDFEEMNLIFKKKINRS